MKAFDEETGELLGETAGSRRRRAPLTPAQQRERERVQAERAATAERDRCIIEVLAGTSLEDDDTPIRSEKIGRVDALGAVGVRILSCPEPKGSELVALVREQAGELGTVRTLSVHKRFVDANALPWRSRGVTMTEAEARALRDALTAWLEPTMT